jgi:hypothetical protein
VFGGLMLMGSGHGFCRTNNDSPLNSYAAALWNDQEGTLKVLL